MNIQSLLIDECLLNPGKPIVVGTSGGADSQCLMHILHQTGFSVVAAYFDHHLRHTSTKDAEVVSDLAKTLDVTFVYGQANVSEFRKEKKLSIEEAGRILRYQFLFKQAEIYQAQAVAVGHHADDQVETVFLHLLRGAGLNGLQGMQPRQVMSEWNAAIPLVRPLLDWWKLEIIQYCQEFNIPTAFDESNKDNSLVRNRIRNTLIPVLETYNPQVKKAIWRMAKILSVDKNLLDSLTQEHYEKCLYRSGEKFLGIKKEEFFHLPTGFQNRILRKGLLELEADKSEFNLIHQIQDHIKNYKTGQRFDLVSGIFLKLESGIIWMFKDEDDIPVDHCPQFYGDKLRLKYHQNIEMENGWEISMEMSEISGILSDHILKNKNPFLAWVDLDKLDSDDLWLSRSRKGAKFQPMGMKKGSMKLSDYFINVKAPYRVRENWPLIYSKDQLVWVPGYQIGQKFCVDGETKTVVQFEIRRNN